jgi:hypothetical protein
MHSRPQLLLKISQATHLSLLLLLERYFNLLSTGADSKHEMPQKPGLRPGSCALRLSNVDHLLSSQKTELINSVADDISTAFICVSRQARAGNLKATNTGGLNRVIRLIEGVDLKYRRHLERKAERYKTSARQWKRQRDRLREELLCIISRIKSRFGGQTQHTKKMKRNDQNYHKRLELMEEKFLAKKNEGKVKSHSQKRGTMSGWGNY